MDSQLEKNTLSEVLDQIWQFLRRGSVDQKDFFHTPSVATIVDGWPSVRTVILRTADPTRRELSFFTDTRAEKWRSLQESPRLTWHFWHPRHRMQLRIKAAVTLHHQDDEALAAWKAQEDASRLNYSATPGPGQAVSTLEDALAAHTSFADLPNADTESWYSNFGMVVTHAVEIDYLLLSRSGHRRAKFELQDGSWNGAWLIP